MFGLLGRIKSNQGHEGGTRFVPEATNSGLGDKVYESLGQKKGPSPSTLGDKAFDPSNTRLLLGQQGLNCITKRLNCIAKGLP
jgi:hypothetical protein